jgi:putative transport protein
MKFDLIAFFLNPLVLLFVTMVLGNLFGELQFKKFKFGITGTLFVGLGIGYFLTLFSATIAEGSPYYSSAMNVMKGNVINGSLMNLALLIFIVGTGLLAAKDMKYAINKFGKQFVIIAMFIPFVGAIASYGFSQAMDNISPFQVTGTYTGALTSSAGLAAATESSESESRQIGESYAQQPEKAQKKILAIINNAKVRDAKLRNLPTPETLTIDNTKELSSEDVDLFVTEAKAGVGVGHSIGYPFGVLFLILGIHIIPKCFGFDVEKEKKKYFAQKAIDIKNDNSLASSSQKEVAMDFVGFSLAAFLGYVVGSIKIFMGPLGWFSLGATGGAIIVALGLGAIGKIGPIYFRMDSTVLGKMRTYFLSVFLAGTGLNYGFRVVDAVTGAGYMIAIISALVAIVSILLGFLLGHYVFHINWTLLSGAITGGMTSAPGLGAAIDALECDEPAVSYGATQPLATFMMVIFSIIIHKLPI